MIRIEPCAQGIGSSAFRFVEEEDGFGFGLESLSGNRDDRRKHFVASLVRDAHDVPFRLKIHDLEYVFTRRQHFPRDFNRTINSDERPLGPIVLRLAVGCECEYECEYSQRSGPAVACCG